MSLYDSIIDAVSYFTETQFNFLILKTEKVMVLLERKIIFFLQKEIAAILPILHYIFQILAKDQRISKGNFKSYMCE